MLALSRRSRFAATLLATGCFAAAYALESLTDDDAALAATLERRQPTVIVPATTAPVAAIAIGRDPFAVPARAVVQRHQERVERVAAIPAVIGPLPANAGAGTMGGPEGVPSNAQLRVVAVATGDHPNALVEAASGVRVVEPGDVVDGHRIGRIETSAVEIDGARIFIDRNDRAQGGTPRTPITSPSPSSAIRTPPPYAPSLPPAPAAVAPTISPGGP